MEQLKSAIDAAFNPDIYKCVISNPVNAQTEYRRIEINQTDGQYHVAQYTATQVFHDNMPFAEMKAYVETAMGASFKNMNAWSTSSE